jgi:DNA-binding NtrC family response regulator
MQPKLLRAIERREIQRIGGSGFVAADVRIIAATHQDLKRGVNERRFRADLYYRLAVLPITVPPLRERIEDLPLLIASILEHLDASEHEYADELTSKDSLAELAGHGWPGNVRELRNYVERCLALRRPAEIDEAPSTDGLPKIDGREKVQVARQRWLLEFERRYLEALLRAHPVVKDAARAAGVARSYLYRMMQRTGFK